MEIYPQTNNLPYHWESVCLGMVSQFTDKRFARAMAKCLSAGNTDMLITWGRDADFNMGKR